MTDLNGKWKVIDDEGEFEFEGRVPGTVQGDLADLGLMPHPYTGTNEKLFGRLEDKSWTYSRDFDFGGVDPEMKYDLVMKGVDTLSKVYLNGEFVGKTENMFAEYRFDVGGLLKPGANAVKVEIASQIKAPKTLERNNGKLNAGEETSRVYIRKAQYSYGWDWGARIAASGIWRDVFIEERPDARLYGSTAYLESTGGAVKVSGKISEISGDTNRYRVEVTVGKEVVGTFEVSKTAAGAEFNGTFDGKDLELWYPRDLGKSALHDFGFTLLKDGAPVYSEKKRIGLRTVGIVRENDGEGESFIFEVNGRKIFAKGANWIPADNVLGWAKKEDYEELVSMAADANMNMLRVWGGGLYENDAFYSKCDELGIMVWQDFMFACAEYPDHLEWFRKLAGDEARHNVVDLRHHPSIVLWCGNNENNWAFEEWNFSNKPKGENLGNTLYLEDLPKICSEENPSTPYWPSSPYGGKKANSEEAGDRHVWNVWSQWADYRHYLDDRSKFVSEFGFQAAPHDRTIEFFAEGKDMDLFSDVMMNHNKQVEGPERLMRFINGHFGTVEDFGAIAYLSQLNQAEAIKAGVEHWRSRKYRTAGTLYWQLNDSWPVFSWSSIDYFKRPKALYEYTRRFYSPVLPIAKPVEGGIAISVVNDLESMDAKLSVEVRKLSGERIFSKEYENLRLCDDCVLPVETVSLKKEDVAGSIVYLRLGYGEKSVENHEMLANLREIRLEDPEISVRENGENIVVSCKKPAYAVKIKTEKDVNPEDNFFSVSPSNPKSIRKIEGNFEILSAYDYLNR